MLAMTIVSTRSGWLGVPKTNCTPRVGEPVSISEQWPIDKQWRKHHEPGHSVTHMNNQLQQAHQQAERIEYPMVWHHRCWFSQRCFFKRENLYPTDSPKQTLLSAPVQRNQQWRKGRGEWNGERVLGIEPIITTPCQAWHVLPKKIHSGWDIDWRVICFLDIERHTFDNNGNKLEVADNSLFNLQS